jgi:hypothetical protein
MSAAAPTTEPDAKPSRSGFLLSLIRKLIDYGKDLATTIRQRAATDPAQIRGRFGTIDLAVILRCIARGLLLAHALEARVLQRAACLDKPPSPSSTRPRATPRPTPPAEPADPPLTAAVPELDPGISLPTPEQIAAEIRRRPIGAVLADICRDFGIPPSHPLMREVREAIRGYGGSVARLLIDMFDRYCPIPRRGAPDGFPGPTSQFLAPTSTGPP